MHPPIALTLASPEAVSHDPLLGLFSRLATGDTAALGPIYDHCGAELFGLALWLTGRTEDAADLVQDALLKVASQGATLTAIRAPRSYLLTAVRRLAIDLARRRRPATPLDDLLLTAPVQDPALAADARRASALLVELPVVQREAIYLRHQAGLSFAEIGRITRVPTFTAASRYRLGIARLRQRLGVTP